MTVVAAVVTLPPLATTMSLLPLPGGPRCLGHLPTLRPRLPPPPSQPPWPPPAARAACCMVCMKPPPMAVASATPARMRGLAGVGGAAPQTRPTATPRAPPTTAPSKRARPTPSPLDGVPLPVVAREWALQETRMRLIADPLSAEGGVARRAYARIAALARSLGLPPSAGELARQAADVLLAGRPDGEPPSDFQDYTVLALVAAAARLAGVRGGAAADPRRLAAAHGQDPDALEAVLDYVMAALNAYRALCDRVRGAFGAAEDALAARAAGGGGGAPPPRPR